MTENSARTDEGAPQLDLIWQRRIDALVSGECSEEDFLHELSRFRQTGGDSAWSVMALLDQKFRRGQVPADLFRSIEAKIARRELATPDYSVTVDLLPSLLQPALLQPAPASAGGAGSRPPTAPQIDRVLRNRYVIERPLGSGGMGTVFKALDRYRCDLPQDNRHVAIKFLHAKTDGSAEILSGLRREFYCAQALSHPNIVKVYELDRDGDSEFFTMEFLEGELLSDLIERSNPHSPTRARCWEIITEIGAGLVHAHARGVVHADLKPQNIMVTKSGEVRILDFGASSPNSNAATPAYASCELLEGQTPDPRDDLFALACVAYELLAGEHPFQRRRSIVARDMKFVAPRPQGLTRQQWRTLSQGLAWRREDRSVSVRDWIKDLQPGTGVARRMPPIGAIAGLAALVLGGALLLTLNRQTFERKAALEPAVPETAAGAPTAAEAAAPEPEPSTETASELQPRPAPASAQNVRAAAQGSEAPKARVDALSISANSYRVGVHDNFAEVHVRRSGGSDKDTSFAWWTEPSSAIPGTDYIAQPRTIQPMSRRSRVATLFVKVVPNVSRSHSAVFYVSIAEPGNGTSLGHITRAAVFLPVR